MVSIAMDGNFRLVLKHKKTDEDDVSLADGRASVVHTLAYHSYLAQTKDGPDIEVRITLSLLR